MLVVNLANCLRQQVGPVGRVLFLIGAWGAVFSSLLGVWQSVPYLFADMRLLRRRHAGGLAGAKASPEPTETDCLSETRTYRGVLLGLTLVPLCLLWISVQQVQLVYAIVGAFFMPLLALSLLVMNNRVSWVGASFRNGRIANWVLVVTLLFFAFIAAGEISRRLAGLFGI